MEGSVGHWIDFTGLEPQDANNKWKSEETDRKAIQTNNKETSTMILNSMK